MLRIYQVTTSYGVDVTTWTHHDADQAVHERRESFATEEAAKEHALAHGGVGREPNWVEEVAPGGEVSWRIESTVTVDGEEYQDVVMVHEVEVQ